MAYYCSKQCQKIDFPDHKHFCLALYDLANLEESWWPCEGESEWNKRIVQHIRLLDDLLDRPATAAEKNFLFFQPKCQVCFLTPLELTSPQKFIPCSNCRVVACCSNEHWDIHRSKHQALCKTYEQVVECDMIQYERGGEGVLWAPETWDKSKSFPPLPADWDAYFAWRKAPSFIPKYARVASHSLSGPLTVLEALERFYKKNTLHSLEELVIHILGAAQFEIMSLMAYEELMHVLPDFKTLRMVLIGFDIPDSKNVSVDCCSLCTEAKRTRNIVFFKGAYHEYVQSSEFLTPHLAVGFNSGLYEDDTELWMPTVHCLIEKDIPCVFTSYSKSEADQDLATIKGWGAKIYAGAKKNKWKSLVPIVEPMIVDKFFHNNNFKTLFKGRL